MVLAMVDKFKLGEKSWEARAQEGSYLWMRQSSVTKARVILAIETGVKNLQSEITLEQRGEWSNKEGFTGGVTWCDNLRVTQ